ncbi:MAG TPA: succinyl-diaminopimelate desuccinylase [Caulobacteraceae bacterium]|jgi:succinyl-diaminopimelate desuccinylase|nr:succinyl-diaminopimelate desuccinylase [Caulobacteraceae bacterium]
MTSLVSIDPVELAREMIRRPSVTPADAGAMDVVEARLKDLGFACRRMRFGAIENLYARIGTARPNLCFAGHTDVVPVGDEAAWTAGPFEAQVRDGMLYGRGAADMKSAIAAFIAAVETRLARGAPKGSISLLITGDEEGEAVDGTKAVVAALKAEGEVIDHCIVGEPTSSATLGDMIKIGRRGSINATITVEGVQGHVAYPYRAANPVRPLIRLLKALQDRVLDEGYVGFQPSNLEVTTIDVGNPATNVIPAVAKARLNIRFNPAHTGASLDQWLRAEAAMAGSDFTGKVTVETQISGEAFLTEPGPFTDLVAGVIKVVTGVEAELSTTGGTSDARFIRAMCPVLELGLVGATMHAVDERAPVAEIRGLTAIYERLIDDYFAAFSS